jgi:hypothetical protein
MQAVRRTEFACKMSSITLRTLYEHRGRHGMSDDPMSRIPAYDRISIRAVLVSEGEDAAAALARAGIIDAVAIPVVLGDDPNLFGGILGDGFTPNPSGVLETEDEEIFESMGGGGGTVPKTERPAANEGSPSRSVSSMLPAAFGMKSLAPVRKIV